MSRPENEDYNYETVYIRDEISKCEDIEELKERIFPMIKTQQDQWAAKINEIIAESGFNKTQFADMTGVSRMSVNKWCNGAIPKNRETFLRIGMAAGYNLEKMNQLLQRYGQYPELYSKNLDDCICMYVLGRNFGSETLSKYEYILSKIKENIVMADSDNGEYFTEYVNEKISEVKSEDELEQFIAENSQIFATTYHKFYAYVKMHIMVNYAASINELADMQEWSSSLRQCVSAIMTKKWIPTRNKIISLGIHLSMDHDQIDEMLEIAHMEPLCAKNIFESVIMFILDDASLNNLLDEEDEDYDPDALCRYAREVLEEFDLPEVDSFISELPEMSDEAW